MTQLKPGSKLKSAVCDAEVVVIRSTGSETLTCGGAPMLAAGEPAPGDAAPQAEQADGCLVGKRYVNEDQTLEVLCVKAGQGTLAANGDALATKEAKKLPSSD